MNFSVLLSIYIKEKPEYFVEAINSILNQSITPNEIVIVKDGPLTDELDKILKHFSISYKGLFKIISLSENKGLGAALREGVKSCTFDIIARMDTDDISHETRFEKQLHFLSENPDVAIVGSNALDFDGGIDNITSKRIYPETNLQIEKFSKRRCPFLHPTVMFKKDAVLNVGNYDNLLWFEDYNLFLKLIKAGYKGYNIQENLLYFRSNEESFKRRGGIQYLVEECKALTFFYKKKYLNLGYYLTSIIIRSLVRVIGNNIRKMIYRRFLRD